MPDESDPPRKFYGLKPKEFERANDVPSAPPPENPTADPGIVSTHDGKIDVRDLIRSGAGEGGQLGHNAVANRDNQVHSILRDNLTRDRAAGRFDLGPLDDSKRRRRIRNYWIILAVCDLPLGLFAWRIGLEAAIPFVCAIAAIAMITSMLTWKTFFLRTHY